MGPRHRILAAALAACALLCASAVAPVRTLASSTQQSVLMDDDELIYASPQHVVARLRQLAAIGVDQVKVSVVWSLVAPDASSLQRPSFDATDPSEYPPGAWDRYDLIARETRALGMSAYFQLDPRVPAWAIPPRQPVQGKILSRAPDPTLFGQFAQAVGRRYSGSFAISSSSTEPMPTPLGLPIGSQQRTVLTSRTIPRVSVWGIWNEPNELSWLSPIRRALPDHRTEYLQPLIYRRLVDAAWQGLAASGHQSDTILAGETANVGILDPLVFLHGVYCVDPSLRPLHGAAAAVYGCPAGGTPAAFVRANRGLFAITGYAHHPYLFDVPPTHHSPDPNKVTLANLGTLERTLERTFAAYGQSRAGGIPLYLSEWGYKSDPPNPFSHTSLAQQAAWLNQGEYLTWGQPFVNSLAQFELVDSPGRAGFAPGTRAYWGTYQTGLMFRGNRAKPSLQAFRIPIWLPVARPGGSVAVWGQLRPADHATLQYGVVEFRARGSRAWSTVREVATDSPEGFIHVRVPIPGPGRVRLAWVEPVTGHRFDSLAVAVS